MKYMSYMNEVLSCSYTTLHYHTPHRDNIQQSLVHYYSSQLVPSTHPLPLLHLKYSMSTRDAKPNLFFHSSFSFSLLPSSSSSSSFVLESSRPNIKWTFQRLFTQICKKVIIPQPIPRVPIHYLIANLWDSCIRRQTVRNL